jgi:transposase-like protein
MARSSGGSEPSRRGHARARCISRARRAHAGCREGGFRGPGLVRFLPWPSSALSRRLSDAVPQRVGAFAPDTAIVGSRTLPRLAVLRSPLPIAATSVARLSSRFSGSSRLRFRWRRCWALSLGSPAASGGGSWPGARRPPAATAGAELAPPAERASHASGSRRPPMADHDQVVRFAVAPLPACTSVHGACGCRSARATCTLAKRPERLVYAQFAPGVRPLVIPHSD